MVMKKFYLLLVITMFFALVACTEAEGNSQAVETENGNETAFNKCAIGFEEEEAAIEYFIGRLNDGDIDGALKVCAFDLMAEGFNYKAQIERLKLVMPIYNVNSSDYEIGKRGNRLQHEYYFMNQLSALVFQLNAEEELMDILFGKTLFIDEVDIDEVIDCFDQSVLEDLELVAIFTLDEADEYHHRTAMEEKANVYGADDMAYKTIIYNFKGDYYQGGAELFCYDDMWYISDLADPIGGIGTTVMLLNIEKEDFEEYLD